MSIDPNALKAAEAALSASCHPELGASYDLPAAIAAYLAAAPTAMQPDGLVGWQIPAADWLDEAAKYFERRPTGGEDAAFWANFANKQICESLAHRLRSMPEAAAIITSLRAENARLRAGLKPFGQMAEVDDYAGTPEGASVIVNVDRLRAARQIINQEASNAAGTI